MLSCLHLPVTLQSHVCTAVIPACLLQCCTAEDSFVGRHSGNVGLAWERNLWVVPFNTGCCHLVAAL
jgi:hypothetical protein